MGIVKPPKRLKDEQFIADVCDYLDIKRRIEVLEGQLNDMRLKMFVDKRARDRFPFAMRRKGKVTRVRCDLNLPYRWFSPSSYSEYDKPTNWDLLAEELEVTDLECE